MWHGARGWLRHWGVRWRGSRAAMGPPRRSLPEARARHHSGRPGPRGSSPSHWQAPCGASGLRVGGTWTSCCAPAGLQVRSWNCRAIRVRASAVGVSQPHRRHSASAYQLAKNLRRSGQHTWDATGPARDKHPPKHPAPPRYGRRTPLRACCADCRRAPPAWAAAARGSAGGHRRWRSPRRPSPVLAGRVRRLQPMLVRRSVQAASLCVCVRVQCQCV